MTIARWFISWAEENEADITNLKLQKLLYYAQGFYLATRDQPLFDDPIQAWSLGPVVPSVYHQFKSQEGGTLSLKDDDEFDWGDVEDDDAEFLVEIWGNFGRFSAWALRDFTHAEPPWKDHFRPNTKNIGIPKSEMRDYFLTRVR